MDDGPYPLEVDYFKTLAPRTSLLMANWPSFSSMVSRITYTHTQTHTHTHTCARAQHTAHLYGSVEFCDALSSVQNLGAYALVRVVQAHRTYTNHTITALARCVGCLCTSSGWYKHSEPHRTYTNHTSTERARCEGCLYTSSGWFKHSEPHRTYTNHTRSTLHTVLALWWCVSCRFAEVRCA